MEVYLNQNLLHRKSSILKVDDQWLDLGLEEMVLVLGLVFSDWAWPIVGAVVYFGHLGLLFVCADLGTLRPIIGLDLFQMVHY